MQNQKNLNPQIDQPNVQKFEKDNFSTKKHCFTPDVKAFETDQSYELNIHLPGVNKTEIIIGVQNGVLNVSSYSNLKKITENSNEISSFSFQRSVALPPNADANHVAAKFEDNVLKVSVPKLNRTKNELQNSVNVE